MTNAIDQLLGIHQSALGARAHRSQVLASNIANADTPGYQARDFDFKAARRLEPVGDERNEQLHQGKHREAECADSALTCQDRVDRIFGNDT